MKQTYHMDVDDLPGLGGEIVVERFYPGVRVLLIETWRADGHRANIVLSKNEVRRLRAQLVKFEEGD